MPRQPERPTYRIARARHPRPPAARFRVTPFHWLVGGGILLLVVITALVAGIFLSRPKPTVTPTLPVNTQPAAATQESEPTSPLPTETQTPLPLPTATPIPCTASRDTQAHTEPKLVTIKEPIASGRVLSVTGKIYQEGILWYQVLLGGLPRYVPAADVECPVIP